MNRTENRECQGNRTYGQSLRARFESALAGEPIDRPVFAVYDWFVRNRDVDWQSLFDRGLAQIGHADLITRWLPNVEIEETTSRADGQTRRDVRWLTDIGELHEWYLGEWRQEHLIKSARDYRIMAHALADAEVTSSTERFDGLEREIGDSGIVLGQLGGWASRSPFLSVQVDFAGLERFSVDIANELPELLELMEVLADLKIRELEAALDTPVRHIKFWENLTIETMGPVRYRKYLVPFYERVFGALRGSDKQVHVHYDGRLRAIAGDIERLAFAGIDSLTPAPEGDLTTAEARRCWPHKFLWLHPSLTWYALPGEELAGRVRNMAREAGPDRYCLMISEEVPSDWERTVPLVLDALGDL
ncbi:MAG: hypothetical protein GWP05_04490 [Anaerolineaceae bacterium]|nr:hypothetical protein [Anaerolineaceae bacterium]